MFRFAQHDRGEDSQAVARWWDFNDRFKSRLRIRALLTLFIATAAVFSVLPLLHYFRGGHLLITNFGTTPANRCSLEMKFISFARGSTISCIRCPAHFSLRARACLARED